MSEQSASDPVGHVDDAAEEQAVSDDSGAAAAGEYDPAQGSPAAPEAPAPSGDAEDVLVEDVPTQSEDPERR